jgi:hypothetical protein
VHRAGALEAELALKPQPRPAVLCRVVLEAGGLLSPGDACPPDKSADEQGLRGRGPCGGKFEDRVTNEADEARMSVPELIRMVTESCQNERP